MIEKRLTYYHKPYVRMRLLFILVLTQLSFTVKAQENNSLLWEISGNGLQKTSYLYGTMHVSQKIAFRLDDVFYEALDKSDIVALESDPSTWLDNDMNMSFNFGDSFIQKGFYQRAFELLHPEKDEIAAYLGFDDQMVNGILYRTNEYSQNFEEDTYLDMFIYQAGVKFNKPIVALEDLEESSTLVGRASFNSFKEKPTEWLQKKMQQKDYVQLVQDAYRERNIDLLDSIDQGLYTDHYLKNMLYIRNENMVTALDSVMKTGKVFTGIGAAHLPGQNGVIQMLKNKGYTLTPLISKSGQKAKTLKSKFENKIFKNAYNTQTVDDALFSIALPNKLYPVAEFSNTFYISPDLANGSFFTANRIPLFSYFKENKHYTMDDIDQLLFENIPGTIMEKTRFTKNGFQALDIKNLLKNGEYQRYQIFLTPLELIIFKMGGQDNYVPLYGDTIFNSIQFKKLPQELQKISTPYQDFEVEMPSYYTFTNNSRTGNRFIHGFDSIKNTYRFLKKVTLHDYNFIEEDTFELKQIQKRFYQKLKLTGNYKRFKNNSLKSTTIIDTLSEEKLHLYTTLQGDAYYLLGMVSKDSSDAERYFNSLHLTKPVYTKAFEQIKDTALFFTTISNVKPPPFVVNSNSFNKKKDIKDYNGYNKKTVYQNDNSEAIAIQLNKAHDFLMFPSIDSVWALRKKLYAGKTFNIRNEIRKISKEGYHELQLTLTDTASTRGILIKNVLKDGLLYEIKAVIDTISKPSAFVTAFYDHFKPFDTVIGKSILTDKTAEFFKALRNKDSIALNGYPFINFEKAHIDSLKHYIATFAYSEAQKDIQTYLIQQLAEIDPTASLDFYADFYKESYNNSSAQTILLQALSKKQTQESVQQLLALMEVDLPLVSSSFEIYKIFTPFRDSLALAKQLFPEILDYSTIEEYKSPIFSLLATLQSEGIVRPKIYKKYKNQILNDAKIQLKRALGKLPNKNNYRNNNLYSWDKKSTILEDYVQLLYPFIKEKEVQSFFEKLALVNDPEIQTTKAALQANPENNSTTEKLTELAEALDSRNLLFEKLKNQGKLAAFPAAYKTQKKLAEAQLFEREELASSLDSIQFVGMKDISYRGKSYVGYAFKYRDDKDYSKNFKMYLAVYEKNEELQEEPFYKNSGYRIEDTDSDEEILNIVLEEFLLRERQRAEVYRPNRDQDYGYFDY